MSIMVATGKAATRGVLFRDAAAIENFRKMNTLIADKTGTLTEGRPRFDRAVAAPGFTQDEVLRLAASLDQGSEHPLAEAIVKAAREHGLALDKAEGFESSTGIGVRGSVGGRPAALGNTALMAQSSVRTGSSLQDGGGGWRRSGPHGTRVAACRESGAGTTKLDSGECRRTFRSEPNTKRHVPSRDHR